MQVKFQRTTGSKGLMTKKITFIVTAILSLEPDERSLMQQFGFMDSALWVYTDLGSSDDDGDLLQSVNTTPTTLMHGVVYEHVNMNEIFRTETRIVDAMKHILSSAKARATFDGSDRVYEVDSEGYRFLTGN